MVKGELLDAVEGRDDCAFDTEDSNMESRWFETVRLCLDRRNGGCVRSMDISTNWISWYLRSAKCCTAGLLSILGRLNGYGVIVAVYLWYVFA